MHFLRLTTLALVATTGSASVFTSSMEAVSDVAERHYIGGPTAIARAMAAARHMGETAHHRMKARHEAKIAAFIEARNDEAVADFATREAAVEDAITERSVTVAVPEAAKRGVEEAVEEAKMLGKREAFEDVDDAPIRTWGY